MMLIKINGVIAGSLNEAFQISVEKEYGKLGAMA